MFPKENAVVRFQKKAGVAFSLQWFVRDCPQRCAISDHAWVSVLIVSSLFERDEIERGKMICLCNYSSSPFHSPHFTSSIHHQLCKLEKPLYIYTPVHIRMSRTKSMPGAVRPRGRAAGGAAPGQRLGGGVRGVLGAGAAEGGGRGLRGGAGVPLPGRSTASPERPLPCRGIGSGASQLALKCRHTVHPFFFSLELVLFHLLRTNVSSELF